MRTAERKKIGARLQQQRFERELRDKERAERENAELREEVGLLRELEASDTLEVRRKLAELRARRANEVRR